MKNFALFIPFLVAFSMALSGCGPKDPSDLERFYFPYERFEDGAVLEYRPVRFPELGNEYWYVKSFSDSGRRYLVTQVFNSDLELQQYKREEYVTNGVLSREVKLLRRTPDTSLLMTLNIQENGVFPFRFKDSLTRYIYDLSWLDPIDSMEYRITRNRRFTHREDRMFLGEIRSSWHAAVLEELETIVEGSTLSSWSGEEWFAENIGLVYFRKQITKEFTREYYLHAIHDWAVFEKQLGPSLINKDQKRI